MFALLELNTWTFFSYSPIGKGGVGLGKNYAEPGVPRRCAPSLTIFTAAEGATAALLPFIG